jgi:hypothetical protein
MPVIEFPVSCLSWESPCGKFHSTALMSNCTSYVSEEENIEQTFPLILSVQLLITKYYRTIYITIMYFTSQDSLCRGYYQTSTRKTTLCCKLLNCIVHTYSHGCSSLQCRQKHIPICTIIKINVLNQTSTVGKFFIKHI